MDLVKLRKQFMDVQDEHAHQCMQTPASDPFQHGIQIGQYRAFASIIESITEALKDNDPD